MTEEKKDPREYGVLVWLACSIYNKYVEDRTESKDLSQRKGVKDGELRVRKTTVPKGTSLAKVEAVERRARDYLNNSTFPFTDDKLKIATLKRFATIAQRLREFELEFWAAVEEFIKDLPAIKLAAAGSLNSTYKESDYPSSEAAARAKFSFEFGYMPIPRGSLFLSAIEDEDAREAANAEETRMADFVKSAMSNASQRLIARRDALEKEIDKRFSDPKSLRRPTLDNFREELQLIQDLNIFENEDVAASCVRMLEKVNGFYKPAFDKPLKSTKRAVITAPTAESATVLEQVNAFEALVGGFGSHEKEAA
jgi:hypothetical protein